LCGIANLLFIGANCAGVDRISRSVGQLSETGSVVGSSYLRTKGPALLIGAAVLGILTAVFSLYVPAVVLCCGVVVLAVWRTELLIWGLVTYTVFEETLLRWLPGEARYMGEVAIISLLVVVVGRQVLFRGKVCYCRTPLELPLAAFLVVALASSWINRVPLVVAVLGVRPWLRYIALFYLVTLLGWSEQNQKRLLWWLLAIAVLEASLGLLQAVGGAGVAHWFAAPDVEFGGKVIQRITPGLIGAKIFGTLGRYDRFGNYLMLMFLLAVAMLPSVSPKRRLGLLAGVAVIGIALALSFSRQAWLGVVVGLGVIAAVEKRRDILMAILAMIVLVLIVFLVGEMPLQSTSGGNPATVVTRLLEPFSQYYWRALNSVGGRMYYVFVIGPKLLNASPWLGLGPGRFASLVTRVYPTPVYEDLEIPQYFADNFASDIQWMSMLGQVGVLGVLAFSWILLRLFVYAREAHRRQDGSRLYHSLSICYLAWTAAVVSISFLGPNLEVRPVSQNFWFLGGLLVSMDKVRHRKSSNQWSNDAGFCLEE
jgi:hypothetical protein